MVTEEQKSRYTKYLKEREIVNKNVTLLIKKMLIFNVSIVILLNIIFGFLAVTADKRIGKNSFLLMLYIFVELMLFLIISKIHVILHEAGHLVFGLLTGYEFQSFRIFSLIFYKKEGKIYKSFHPVKGIQGQCLMNPPEQNKDGSFPFVLLTLGGGISNLLFSVPFIIPALLTDNLHVRNLYLILFFTGILLGAINLIPISLGIQNDGMNLVSMMKDKQMQVAFYLQLKLTAEMSNGKELIDYPSEIFELPKDTNDTNMLTAYLRLKSYYQQLAFNNYEEADNILSLMEDKSDHQIQAILNTIELERLFLMIMQKRSLEEVAAVYKHCKYIINNAKCDIAVQRVNYLYEISFTEQEKKYIMTLINNQPPKEWVACDEEKLYKDFINLSLNHPVIGERNLYVNIVESIRSNRQCLKEGL